MRVSMPKRKNLIALDTPDYQAKYRKIPSRHGIKVRSCMSCKTEFKSEGPQNRLCEACRHGSEDFAYALEIPRK